MSEKSPSENKNKIVCILKLLAKNFFAHDVGKQAASLAYYFVFALFPILIFLSNLLGLLDLNVAAITNALLEFLPHDVVGIIESYLEHISHTSSRSLLLFALIFSVWFPMRAAKGLMNDVRRAYHLGKPDRIGIYLLRQLIYTFILLLVIGLSLPLSALGKHVILQINLLLPESAVQLSSFSLTMWQYLRFLPVAFLMFIALATLYAAALGKRQPIKEIWPGIAFAMVAWVLVSICFSFYVNRFANYSVIYGTLGAVIVLLMWLYFTALILIIGAELNAVLHRLRTEKAADTGEQP